MMIYKRWIIRGLIGNFHFSHLESFPFSREAQRIFPRIPDQTTDLVLGHSAAAAGGRSRHKSKKHKRMRRKSRRNRRRKSRLFNSK
jgi:hypothetical protein